MFSGSSNTKFEFILYIRLTIEGNYSDKKYHTLICSYPLWTVTRAFDWTLTSCLNHSCTSRISILTVSMSLWKTSAWDRETQGENKKRRESLCICFWKGCLRTNLSPLLLRGELSPTQTYSESCRQAIQSWENTDNSQNGRLVCHFELASFWGTFCFQTR